jgi:hypothetical protein
LTLRLNSVVNLSGKHGKFLAIDEFNEWIVRAVKDMYNVSGSMQSTKFTCEVISPNVIPLHHAAQNVLRSSGAPTYGYKHSRVDDKRDVKAILQHLLKEKVFCYTPGREVEVSENIRAIPSKDLYSSGIAALNDGVVLARYVKKKLAQSAGEAGGVEDAIEDNEPVDADDDGEDHEQGGLFGSQEPEWSFGDSEDGADSSVTYWQWDRD